MKTNASEWVILLLMIPIIFSFGCTGINANSTYNYTTNQHDRIEVYPLHSLSTSKDLSGSFVIGIGNVGTDFYYYVYVEQPDGSIKFQSLKAKYVSVFQTNDTPRLECGINGYDCNMYIPENTIKQEYKVSQ